MPIPLFRLPRKPLDSLKIVLKSMDIVDLIRLSLLSKAIEAVIATTGIGINKFSLNLHECFMISLETQEGYLTWDLSPRHEDWNGGDPVALTMANPVVVTHSKLPWAVRTFQWNNIEGFGIKNWILHFQNITHTRTIHEVSIDGRFEKFEVNSVARTLEGLDIDLLVIEEEPTCTDGYCNSIYQKVHTRNLGLDHNPFRNSEEFQKVLIQNIRDVSVFWPTLIQITLDDLLMMNCERLAFEADQFSIEDLNKFLKFWMKGFNRRLTYLEILFDPLFVPVLDRNEILRGIPHNEGKFINANSSEATIIIDRFRFSVEFVHLN